MIRILKRHRRKEEIKRFKKQDIPKLKYGMIHSLFGDVEGVSIVMKQIEGVLNKNLKVPKKNIFYLIGKSKIKSPRIIEKEILWNKNETNQLMLDNYQIGYGGENSEKIEIAITEAKKVIRDFIRKNKIDILIAHNTAHPINFVGSVALSRYYRDEIKQGRKTPKYVLWWHDSHLERRNFINPPMDVNNYLLQGVPGNFVEYIIFINSLQFKKAKRYFKKLDKTDPGFYHQMEMNHDIVYNTTDVFINKFRDLQSDKFNDRVDKFIADFKIRDLLKKRHLQLSDVLFCLQHTRLVARKRIDFALKYCYVLLEQLRKRNYCKAMYFLVSGHTADTTRRKLLKLNRKLKEEYKIKNLFLIFAEDYYNKTNITFEEYPKIFAKLGGFSTYFSEVEGFGNNLLEVLASGLIPVVYRYNVFKKDISKYNFKLIALNKYEINMKKIDDTIGIIRNKTKKREWVDKNLRILKKHFPHKTIAVKLIQAITSKRIHK
jgi:hypothetical protein